MGKDDMGTVHKTDFSVFLFRILMAKAVHFVVQKLKVQNK